jgi:drug/metabolite transporter (DMT)-like permease
MNAKSPLVAVASAFACVYIVWGTTYLAIAIAIRSAPPFVAGTVRFFIAGAVMYTWLRLRERKPLAGINLPIAALSGVLFLGMGNGFVMWAQQGVPSGIAALIVGAVPVLVQVFDWMFFSRRAPAPRAMLGIGIALLGVVIVILHTHSLAGEVKPSYLFAMLVAVTAWSFGTLLQRGAVAPGKLLAFGVVQMFAGSAFQALMGVFTQEWRTFDAGAVEMSAWLAILYLAIPGSVIAFTAYLWLLSRVSAQKATTYALVNPVVALTLGAVVLGERITPLSAVAATLVIVGVGIVLLQPTARASASRQVDDRRLAVGD